MKTAAPRDSMPSGATPGGRAAYERALAAFRGWRSGAEDELALALQEAPGFVMAHVLQAYLLLSSRDPRSVRAARPVLARAVALPADEGERLHIAAIAAVLADDFKAAKSRLGELLQRQPRDALALQVAHGLDYVTGDAAMLKDRVAAVLPAWSNDLPGYSAVLAMHAFGLVECGEVERAEEVAREALGHDALEARAHHVMAHVFEMSERPDEGARWMASQAGGWSEGTVVATHGWWHLALFHLAQERDDLALKLYDGRIRAGRSTAVADLIDAASLLWRLHLRGTEGGARWHELACAWAAHIEDGHCSFNDLHAMLAFVGARDWDRAQRLEFALSRAQSLPTRYGLTTRQLGLPACRALVAFGRGDDALTITLLASLPQIAHRLGGSHAQRDVLYLTLGHAIDRLRRPRRARRLSASPA
jgi:hypothetical protein